jgi:hypothetical protein
MALGRVGVSWRDWALARLVGVLGSAGYCLSSSFWPSRGLFRDWLGGGSDTCAGGEVWVGVLWPFSWKDV